MNKSLTTKLVRFRIKRKESMRSVISLCLFFLLLGSHIYSQQLLTLDDAISIALGESYSIQSAKYSLVSSQKTLEAVKLGLRSTVDMEFDLPNYYRTLSSQFNPATGSEQFYAVGATKVEGRLYVRQPLVFSNGTVSLVGSLFGREQFTELENNTRDFYTNLSFQLNQPLFTFNNQKANLERAEINLEKTERNYSQTERDIIYNVTASFFGLYQAKERVEIAAEKVKQTETSYNTANNKFKAGLIAEVEALQLEVDLASSRSELLNAERRFEEERNNFKLLIGVDLDEEISVTTDLEYMGVEVDLEDALSSALKNRPDLLNSEANIYLSELNIDEVDARRTIRADLNATYGINNTDEKFNALFKDFFDDRSVVMTLSVPVFDWGRNAREVESAEADHKETMLSYKNLKDQIKNEVIRSYNRLMSAKAQVEVLSKSVVVAEKSYNISSERFKAGTITSFDLQQMQLRLTDTKLNNLSALIDYKVALADLERKTFLKYN